MVLDQKPPLQREQVVGSSHVDGERNICIGGIHSEHAHEHLLKHRGLAVGGRHVLTQVAGLDMEA